MNFSKKTHELIRQNEKIVKKPQKHDANLQKNSTLYFQIGLILCLMGAYAALEMNFMLPQHEIIIQDDLNEDTHFTFVVPKTTPKRIAKVTPKKVRPTIIKTPIINKKPSAPILSPKTPVESLPSSEGVIKPKSPPPAKKPEGPFNIMGVEQVPIYPGCEKALSNDERRLCLESKIAKLVKRKFDTDMAAELGLNGVQNILVVFKINKTGQVEILKTRAAHDGLEKEANRVVNKIPKMIPGKQSDQNVDVIYNLPIRFQIIN